MNKMAIKKKTSGSKTRPAGWYFTVADAYGKNFVVSQCTEDLDHFWFVGDSGQGEMCLTEGDVIGILNSIKEIRGKRI